MKRGKLIFITLFLLFILLTGLFIHALMLNANDWRERGQRYNYGYSVEVNGLSGKEVTGTTIIMVPIPATKDGEFVVPPPPKEPVLIQKLTDKYILHTPEECRNGPYFKNMTEIFDNKSIIGDWTTFVAQTEGGYMLGFRTNASTLKDISFGGEMVVDYIDIFNPIDTGGPMLYPVRNLSEIELVSYGDQVKYSSNPTYESYVYLSDNLEGGIIHFSITLDAKNDPTEWPKEYRGSYLNQVWASVDGTGKIKVTAVLEQSIPHGSGPAIVQQN